MVLHDRYKKDHAIRLVCHLLPPDSPVMLRPSRCPSSASCTVYIYIFKNKSRKGCKGWRDGACINSPCDACQWQTVFVRGCLPFRHCSQTLLASGERQRRDRASGKPQCTQLLRRGRGNLGVASAGGGGG